MRMEARFIIRFCLVLLQMWDLSASQRSGNNGSNPNSTAAATLTAVVTHSPSSESITNAGHLITAGPAVTKSQSPAPATGVSPSSPAHVPAGPQFHVGSFLGGMMLAFVLTLTASLGYRLACSRQTVRYRAIEEHDAVI